MDICIKNPMDECTHECPGCDEENKPEPDEDYQRDYEKENKYYD